MELNGIKQLLAKYYEGMASVEEEQILKDYFQKHAVPAELEADKQLFTYTASEAKTLIIGLPLEQKLTDWIDKQDRGRKKVRRLTWGYRLSAIAASAAIILVCYLTMFKPKNDAVLKDTYNNPQLAYAEAKKALLYVSEQLNRGTAPLSQVSKLNSGINKLSSISSLNNGLEQLQLISKYYNTPKTENNKTK